MKKLISSMLLVVMACVFASCQKGENFFHGTWQSVGFYSYEDKNGDEHQDIYTIELTLDKKDAASLAIDYPQEPSYNVSRTGTYKFYNDHTISITFPETRMDDEIVILVRKYEQENVLYTNYFDGYFTKVKNK